MSLRDTIDQAVDEKTFQQAVVDLARTCGWLSYHTLDSRGSVSGFPDLVLARDGQIVFAELKTEHGTLRPEQARWLEALRGVEHECQHAHSDLGGVDTYLWRPSSWDAIVERLR